MGLKTRLYTKQPTVPPPGTPVPAQDEPKRPANSGHVTTPETERNYRELQQRWEKHIDEAMKK